jgi:hypothetical protein
VDRTGNVWTVSQTNGDQADTLDCVFEEAADVPGALVALPGNLYQIGRGVRARNFDGALVGGPSTVFENLRVPGGFPVRPDNPDQQAVFIYFYREGTERPSAIRIADITARWAG